METGEILALYPLPIARGWRRFLNSDEGRDRHDAAYYLYEVYLKYCASFAMARYVAGEARDHRINAVLKGLVRPSLGETWTSQHQEHRHGDHAPENPIESCTFAADDGHAPS